MSQNLAEQAPRRYDDWYATPAGARVAKAQEPLLAELLDSLGPVEMVLDVGCGTGHFTRWLAVRGIRATGLDLSGAMLAVARERSPGIQYIQGTAEALRFAEASFDMVTLTTSLEFVPNQEWVLVEAARLARRSLRLRVLNLASPLRMYRKALSRFRPSRYRHARIVTPWGPEKWLDRNLADPVEGATLNTTLLPRVAPFGAFIGAAVILRDRGGAN